MDKKTAGALGEEYTAQWLSEHGYTILERNWHSRRGEVDIIASKGDIVAFVEVKTRRDGAMVSPYFAVVYQKQRKLAITAQAYCFTHRCELQPRFDVAAVTIADGKVTGFDYMESAFDGSVVDDSF